ncbi:MAG TPA: DUF4492 domain-containing protein [Bacteroidales bacterium]|nr:DUF4492 domain-containing protein [Bacteroidales bacterium]HQB79213.1 DUF4492 domain-containing protein [Tenuifilaceae bacterium]
MKNSILSKVFYFYYDGFKSMTIGKTLWMIIIIKLFIMFFVFRLFLFPNYLKSNFNNNQERSNHVLEQLINTQ